MVRRSRHPANSGWPPLPENGAFPEVLNTVEVAQLLRYDAEGVSVDRGKRNVQWLVRNRRLPVLAKLGQKYLYSKSAVLAWLTRLGNDTSTQDTTEPPEEQPEQQNVSE